ncbi:MAG: hypothetical protein EXX96DRAFT_604455 [Benjaminiella poitrasii]|nr:MAG: hypothetical protein EXX96DRAFT_604455 [Benjaminiella poitrasii]
MSESISQLLKESIKSSVDNFVSNNSILDKMASHLNRVLRPEDDERALFDKLFENAEEAMSCEQDKEVLKLLKSQLTSFIVTALGVSQFVSNEEGWKAYKEDYNKQGLDIYSPERAEHEHIRRELEEELYGNEAGSGEEEDDEEEEESEEEEEVVESVQVRSRDMGSDGFQTVVRRQKKTKKKKTTTTYNVTNNSYTNNRPYYKQQTVRRREFCPEFLEREDIMSGETFCMPVFFPSEESYSIFHSALSTAKETLHICVFSLTDNDTANVLIDAKRRGVDVKIITDNDQMDVCKGADVIRLYEQHNIPFKTDDSDQFMHNKFAVIDQKIVITGSFNWSAGARYKNRENIIITNIPSVVHSYHNEFNKLWRCEL